MATMTSTAASQNAMLRASADRWIELHRCNECPSALKSQVSEHSELLYLQKGIRLASPHRLLGREMLVLLSVVTSGLCRMPGTAIEELPPTIPSKKQDTAASQFLSELTEVGQTEQISKRRYLPAVVHTEAGFVELIGCSGGRRRRFLPSVEAALTVAFCRLGMSSVET